MEFKKITYYFAINFKTQNWCISKTQKYCWSSENTNNLIFDTGWIHIIKARKVVDDYCKEQLKNGFIINVIN